jgi:predicted O-methyltransferase YrrM
MKKLISAIKRKIPVYQYNIRLIRELAIWKKGYYPPGHYYSPIVSKDSISSKASIDYNQLIGGIDLQDDSQFKLLNVLKENYTNALFPFKKHPDLRYYFENDYFSFSDGIFLSLLMRHFKPESIIEVGSGFSSAVMLDTNEKHLSNKTQLTFIEPYPEERLHLLLRNGDNCTVKKEFVQQVDPVFFTTLLAGDMLFIDSSHVSKYKSDVNFILFEVLPILNSGVIVHFHDIFFPFEYPVEWLQQGRSWNEAYLLKAFLQYNSQYDILLFSSYLEGKYRTWFEQHMPLCLKNHESIPNIATSNLMQTTGQSIYIVKK